MRRIAESVLIDRPVDEVFAFLTDFENNPRWESGVIEARQRPPGPVGVGTTLEEVRQFMGRRIATTYEVIEYEPNVRLVLQSTSGPVQVKGGYLLAPKDGRTTLTDATEFETNGFFRLAEPLFTRMVRRTLKKNFAAMKLVLESRAAR